jgi:ATP-dependent exoDNAse (exonuclease V) alpha subunit
VIDEAGMLPTRQLARLLAATMQVQGKLVLVGDHRQLPELAAGGAFRALARRLDPAVLRDNRRQNELWERDALDQLRSGQIEPALQAYTAAGRVTTSSTGQLQKAALVSAWWTAQRQRAPADPAPSDDVVMLAARRADVADLNARARALMAAHGRLTGPTVCGYAPDGQRHFAVGDMVIARRNDYTAGLFNGQRGVITHVDPDRGTAALRINDRDVVVGRRYLQAGNLDHGYALTIHQAQGLTTGRALVLGNDSLYRESGYVALSRGRIRNDLHLADRPDNLDPLATQSHTPQTADHHRPDPTADLTQTLQRSRAQTMALDQLTRNQRPSAGIDL